MNKKVVFLDIDGTLVTRMNAFPESAKEALRRARANGHEMVICTGRARCQIPPWDKEGLIDGMITAAGSCVYVGEKVAYAKLFSDAQKHFFADYCLKYHIPYFFQAEDALYSAKWCEEDDFQIFLSTGLNESEVRKVLSTVDFVEHPEEADNIEKALYYNCKRTPEQVKADFGEEFYITDSSFKASRFCDGEVTLAGIDKSAGIAAYLEAVGVPLEDSIAFGDGPNDLEMLSYVHTGVAMGNGIQALKDIATFVTDDVDKDGIYNGFQRLGLI